MLYRKLTVRESVLILLLALVLVGFLYYLLIQQPVSERHTEIEAESATIESDIMIAQARQADLQRMQQELPALQQSSVAPLPEYDNILNVMNLLNTILTDTSDYSVDFEELDLSGDVVRRVISLRFTCADYTAARSAIRAIAGSPYRCQIGNVDLSAGDRGLTVSLTVTFFELQTDAVLPEQMPEQTDAAVLPDDAAQAADPEV